MTKENKLTLGELKVKLISFKRELDGLMFGKSLSQLDESEHDKLQEILSEMGKVCKLMCGIKEK